MTQEAAFEALNRTDDAISALRRMLEPVELARLHQRPPSGEWSPMENVRHVIFAEQRHFSLYLKGFRWSSVGVPPPSRVPGETRLSPAGKPPNGTIDDVFDAWQKVHAVVRARCAEAPDGLVRDLDGNFRHLILHARTIERLLG